RVTQERNQVVAQLHAGPADTELIVRAARHHALATDADVVVVLDRVRIAIGDAESEEGPDPSRRVALGTPDELVEVVIDVPRVALGVEGRAGRERGGKAAREDRAQKRPGISEPGDLLGEERVEEVAWILNQRRALLVAPRDPARLMAQEPEGFDRPPP